MSLLCGSRFQTGTHRNIQHPEFHNLPTKIVKIKHLPIILKRKTANIQGNRS